MSDIDTLRFANRDLYSAQMAHIASEAVSEPFSPAC